MHNTIDPVIIATAPLIPPPHATIRQLMLSISMLVAGPVDTSPHRSDSALKNCIDMPEARLLLTGTRCQRPLLTREVNAAVRSTRRDAIVVRLGGERGSDRVSFDVHVFGAGIPLLAYRLWMTQSCSSAWLIPTICDQPFIRLDPAGLDMQDDPPFVDEVDRHRGIVRAKQYLSVALDGWF